MSSGLQINHAILNKRQQREKRSMPQKAEYEELSPERKIMLDVKKKIEKKRLVLSKSKRKEQEMEERNLFRNDLILKNTSSIESNMDL
jgi:hypothetical protein